MFKRIFWISCALLCLINISYAKPFTVVLDWFVNPDHMSLIIAQEEGYFAKQGLDVKIIPPADATDGVKMVAANQADIAVTYQPDLMINVSNGLPIVRVATLIDHPLNALVVLKNGPILTLKDLKNKRVGYTPGYSNMILVTMLKNVGLNLDDVQLIAVQGNLSQALMTHQIDGFIGGMRNFEPIEMELNGVSTRLFYPEENGVPNYDELILVANKSQINNPNLKKFLIALQQGVDDIEKNPRQTWTLFSNSYPEINNTLNANAWTQTLPYLDQHPACLDEARYESLSNFMQSLGIIKNVPPLNTYAVQIPENCMKG